MRLITEMRAAVASSLLGVSSVARVCKVVCSEVKEALSGGVTVARELLQGVTFHGRSLLSAGLRVLYRSCQVRLLGSIIGLCHDPGCIDLARRPFPVPNTVVADRLTIL